jgi:sorbitol/mannitol transport system substrate-binding protein
MILNIVRSTMVFKSALSMMVFCTLFASVSAATELVVATVNNGHMIEMQKLSKVFEKANPDITLKWITLEESDLRQRVTKDIETKGGQFDVMTIGMYETPIWSKKGWLKEIQPDAAYDIDDLLPAMRRGLSVDGKLYASPFYGESSMLIYRKDLADKAGVQLPDRPKWTEIRALAAKIHDPKNGIYGICLRGKPGWGDNIAIVSTMVNSFGGQWFDMGWRPQIESKPWKDAVSFYVNLLNDYGQPKASEHSFNEILALYNAGKCGIWVDATIAASFINDPKLSKVADKVAYTQAPSMVTTRGSNWLWAWALAIPSSTTKVQAAERFVRWATSKEYIKLVGSTNGWATVPSGTRKSTYSNAGFLSGARFALAERLAIDSANSSDNTLPKSPYIGIQFAAIPEFQSIGSAVAIQINMALAAKITVDAALKASQAVADLEMKKAGYYK